MSEPFVIDPSDKLDYSVDYITQGWLKNSDTISVSTWAITPTGPTLSNQSVNGASTIATCVVTGCTVNVDYLLTNQITTVSGLIKQRSIKIQCREM